MGKDRVEKDIMDTQDLSDIRKMLGDIQTPSSSEFNLDSILAEVGGEADQIAKEEYAEETRYAPQPKAENPDPRMESAPTETPEKQRSRFRVIETPEIRRSDAERAASSYAAAQGATARLYEEDVHREHVRKITPKITPEITPNVPEPAEEPELEELSPREARRLEKLEDKKHKAAEKARRTQEDHEEENYEPRDPRVAQNACRRRARGLSVRSVPVFLLMIGAIYLTLAPGMGWPLPSTIDFKTNTITTVLALLIMQFVAMLIALDIVGGGLYALFTGAPDRKTLVTMACLSTLLHGITMIVKPEWGGLLPYCAVSILLLFAAMQEERLRFAGRQRAFKAAMMATHPIGVYSHKDGKHDLNAAVKCQMKDARAFLVELEKPDTVTQFGAVYSPIMLAASLIFAIIVSVVKGEPTRFFWALSVLLSISAPLGILCAAGPSYKNASRRLLAEGAAIVGSRSAATLRKTKQVILTDSDLFPAGSITVDGVRNYGNYLPEKLLAYAAAVTGGQGLEIGRIFSEMLREQYGRPVKATNVLQYESGGLSADIGSDSVLVGTAAFLIKLHIRIKDIHGVENGVFVVINNQVAGVFVLTYHPSTTSYSALHAFRRLRKKPILATLDFNITPAMVESLFELRNGATEPTMDATVMTDPAFVRSDTVCGILTHAGVTPLAQLLHSAERLNATMRTNLTLGTLSGVCGVLLVFYLANLFKVEALQPKNLLLYLLLWYIPMLLMNLSTRKKY